MNTFILTSAVMVLGAILLFALSLLRKRKIDREDTRSDNIRIARERLADLDSEHAKGELSDEEFAQAKQDLEIALAQDLSTATSANDPGQRPGAAPITLLLIAIAVPVIVYISYQSIGSPQHLDVFGPGQPAVANQTPAGSIDALVDELQRRLEANPENPDGWFLLGRTYMRLERYADAEQAYARLNKLLPNQPTVLVSLADAISMQHDGEIPDAVLPLLEQAIDIDPQAVSALWMAGNAYAQREQDQKAVDYWLQAYPLLDDQPDAQQQLRSLIGHIASRSDLAVTIPETLPQIMPQPMPQSAAPAVATSDDIAEGEGLLVEVALDAEWADKVADNDTVFVYAKAAAGPPMPLAVARKQVRDLPLRVRLNDGMAMMPQMKLSNFEQVLVGARISKSGQAMPQSGDLFSTEVATESASQDSIQLLINQQKP